jgi:hypothetical protein
VATGSPVGTTKVTEITRSSFLESAKVFSYVAAGYATGQWELWMDFAKYRQAQDLGASRKPIAVVGRLLILRSKRRELFEVPLGTYLARAGRETGIQGKPGLTRRAEATAEREMSGTDNHL